MAQKTPEKKDTSSPWFKNHSYSSSLLKVASILYLIVSNYFLFHSKNVGTLFKIIGILCFTLFYLLFIWFITTLFTDEKKKKKSFHTLQFIKTILTLFFTFLWLPNYVHNTGAFFKKRTMNPFGHTFSRVSLDNPIGYDDRGMLWPGKLSLQSYKYFFYQFPILWATWFYPEITLLPALVGDGTLWQSAWPTFKKEDSFLMKLGKSILGFFPWLFGVFNWVIGNASRFLYILLFDRQAIQAPEKIRTIFSYLTPIDWEFVKKAQESDPSGAVKKMYQSSFAVFGKWYWLAVMFFSWLAGTYLIRNLFTLSPNNTLGSFLLIVMIFFATIQSWKDPNGFLTFANSQWRNNDLNTVFEQIKKTATSFKKKTADNL